MRVKVLMAVVALLLSCAMFASSPTIKVYPSEFLLDSNFVDSMDLRTDNIGVEIGDWTATFYLADSIGGTIDSLRLTAKHLVRLADSKAIMATGSEVVLDSAITLTYAVRNAALIDLDSKLGMNYYGIRIYAQNVAGAAADSANLTMTIRAR